MSLNNEASMLVKIRGFQLSDGKYNNLCELAEAMEISVNHVYRVRQGKRNINQKFIIGAIKAFPGYRFDDLFYLSSDEAVAATCNHFLGLIGEPAAKASVY